MHGGAERESGKGRNVGTGAYPRARRSWGKGAGFVFTGLIEEMGTVLRAARIAEGRRIAVRAGRVCDGLRAGDSIAVNGVCQTVTSLSGSGLFEIVAVGETLKRTTLGSLRSGDSVNLERPLRMGDRLGGHWVNGHVDRCAAIEAIERIGDDFAFRIGLPPELALYVVEKGSIAVDGVSLTVGEVDDRGFRVHIIPETRERTLFGSYRVGDSVNLEVDILAKYVRRALGQGLGPEHGHGRGSQLGYGRGPDLAPGAGPGPGQGSGRHLERRPRRVKSRGTEDGWSSSTARRIFEAWQEENGHGPTA